jgi:hypothetical protein
VQGKTAGTGEQDWIELKKKSKEIQAAAIEERGRPNDGKKYARPAAGGIAHGQEEPPCAVGRIFNPTKKIKNLKNVSGIWMDSYKRNPCGS